MFMFQNLDFFFFFYVPTFQKSLTKARSSNHRLGENRERIRPPYSDSVKSPLAGVKKNHRKGEKKNVDAQSVCFKEVLSYTTCQVLGKGTLEMPEKPGNLRAMRVCALRAQGSPDTPGTPWPQQEARQGSSRRDM